MTNTKSERSSFVFWKRPFVPVVALLHRIHTGSSAKPQSARFYWGLMFSVNHHPDRQGLKIAPLLSPGLLK